MNTARKNEVVIGDKHINLDEFPNPVECGGSDEEIAAFVDRYFDACIKHELSEAEAMKLFDAHCEVQAEAKQPKIDLTPFYTSEDNVPHEYEEIRILSKEEVANLVDGFFEEVERKNNMDIKNSQS